MNSYFVDHPEMVLGDTVLESTPYGKDDITVRPIPGAELSDLLKEAVSHIQGTYQAVELPEADGLGRLRILTKQLPKALASFPNRGMISHTHALNSDLKARKKV